MHFTSSYLHLPVSKLRTQGGSQRMSLPQILSAIGRLSLKPASCLLGYTQRCSDLGTRKIRDPVPRCDRADGIGPHLFVVPSCAQVTASQGVERAWLPDAYSSVLRLGNSANGKRDLKPALWAVEVPGNSKIYMAMEFPEGTDLWDVPLVGH